MQKNNIGCDILRRFILEGKYVDLFKHYGINMEEVLRKAELPEDLFSRKSSTMLQKEYFKFMEVVGGFIENSEVPVKMASMDNIECFSPPIFAAYCSKNGVRCLERLSKYKKLIGPMVMLLIEKDGIMSVEYTTEDGNYELPQFLVETEFVFLTEIIRRATNEVIIPAKVEMRIPVKTKAFESFLGISVEKGERNIISYHMEDLQKPFISYDESMWNYFKPELSKRLSELDVDTSMGARVRTALTELLPGGMFGIDDVALKLGVSKRTLQRKLSDEGTTFQKQLNNTREMLAINYINNTDMSTSDIAYLLGYQELNSFLRAFTVWTGKSMSEYKKLL